MFTGLIEETGRVAAFMREGGGWGLSVEAGIAADCSVGDSVAVNGCCLTVARKGEGRLEFDILEETRRRTNFSALARGARVNLERALRADSRLGGHFVTGHIDATGAIEALEPRGPDRFLRVRVPDSYTRYVVPKGSIALDGISLTVAEVDDRTLAVWIIPHTHAVTNLFEKKPGDLLNLEFDLLAKHVERLLARGSAGGPQA